MKKSKDVLLEEGAKLVVDARAILDKATAEDRDASAEEREQFDRMMDESDALKALADEAQGDEQRAARLDAREAELEETRGRVGRLERADRADTGSREDGEQKATSRTIELRASVLGTPRRIIVEAEQADLASAAFSRYLAIGDPTHLRALQKDSDIHGGYLSAPIQFQAQLIQELDNMLWMRQICNVLPPITTADTLGAPSLDTDIGDVTWTVELGTGDEDSSLAFGKRELTPHPMARLIKISKTLIRRSQISAEAIVRERLAFKNGAVQENAFLNGSGAQQPLGVFTASDDGISTGRDVSEGNTATEIRYDGLYEALYSLKAQYRTAGLNWIFHRDAVKQIRKLQDGDGQYIWERSVRAGEPDTLMAYPIRESEYAPSTFTASLYVGLLGNFKYYWVVDALTLTIERLTELYALSNQMGYISRSETDGMPVLESAFARVKLGS